METLIDLLRDAQEIRGNRTALSFSSGLREDTWSYRRLWDSANAIAGFLINDVGLKTGHRVVVWGPNCPQLVASYFGIMLARLILVPIDPYSTNEFLKRVADKTDAAAIISGFAQLNDLTITVLPLSELPFDSCAPFSGEPPKEDDIAEIVFTSGTTGNPKGVILTHANIVADIQSTKDLLPANPCYRLLSILPLSHMLEQTIGLYVPLLYGSSVCYPTSRHSPVIVKTLRRHHITLMVLVPQVMTMLLNRIERQVRQDGTQRRWKRIHRVAAHLPMRMRRWLFRDVHRQLGGQLRLFICGGAYLSPELSSTWERMGITVLEGYGTTECAPVVATNTWWTRRHGTVGRPAPNVCVRLSQDGEILVKGANVTQGYWQDEQLTRDAFTEDGWYRTGDIADQDADGFLTIKGRLKDVIALPSGLKVYPEDVERELAAEEEIADCVVLGMPDSNGKILVHAVVIPANAVNDSAEHQRMNQAIRGANTRLAPHQRIGGVTIWRHGEFPRTNLLKVKRHEVIAMLSGQRTSFVPMTRRPLPEADRMAALRGILSELSGVSSQTVTPDSDLTLDLNLDSLSRLELAVRLEEDLGVLLDDDNLAAASTVAQLFDIVEHGETAVPSSRFPTWSLRKPARIFRAILQTIIVFPVHRLICRPFRVVGAEHLQSLSPPVLLIANHSSHLDTPSILRALPRRMRNRVAVAAAVDYFYRTRLLGLSMSLLLNTFPFSRETAVRSSMEYCGELVDDGWSILIYPEGTRSRTGTLQPFKSGIGLLATGLQVPIIPISVEGSFAILPKGRHRPRRGPVTVRFGPPILVAPYEDHLGTTRRLQQEVAALVQ